MPVFDVVLPVLTSSRNHRDASVDITFTIEAESEEHALGEVRAWHGQMLDVPLAGNASLLISFDNPDKGATVELVD